MNNSSKADPSVKPRTQNLSFSASPEEVKKAYSSPPWWYDIRGFFILTFTYQTTLWPLVRFFSQNLSQKHMEIAIGSGTMFKLVLRQRGVNRHTGGSIVGMDYSEVMLAGARKRFAAFKNIALHRGDVAQLDAEDGTYSSVNLANCIHCFADPAAALREVHRVLRPRGSMAVNVLLYPVGNRVRRAIATAINNWGIRKGLLITLYEPAEIKQLIDAAGFDIWQEKISGNCYSILAKKRSPSSADDAL